MKKILLTASLLGFLIALVPLVQAGSDDIVGTWLVSKKDSQIQIYKCGKNYCGKIAWLLEKKDVKDEKNPDPAKRSRSILGLVMMWGFTYDGANTWKDGRLYDAGTGKTYCGKMWMSDGQLKLKGNVCYLPFLGAVDTWTRAK